MKNPEAATGAPENSLVFVVDSKKRISNYEEFLLYTTFDLRCSHDPTNIMTVLVLLLYLE